MSCDFTGTFTGITDLTTPPSETTYNVWCDQGQLIAGCHEADCYILASCPICLPKEILND